ncbi:hypothetical protein BKK51_03575 [Rodentibacter trehalosifermentans]|uniref:Uncharacterized protein n=1 Tax=Rodentibacter trehalosifermentans TaxID=1908263 RepID=A0A1V3IW01_9PAST|nr:hypothetical protein [Rodentibacter trehalosifermentans]OOF46257.1 hypothetical protein BKK51_03575 [Rodentibacter trehalosifermentans]OOF50449.1 hypothetical protein BKK53_07960 [Rodentibacter trehalosifermentans]
MSVTLYRKLRKSTPWIDVLTTRRRGSKVPPLTDEELLRLCRFVDDEGNVVYDLTEQYRRYKRRTKNKLDKD